MPTTDLRLFHISLSEINDEEGRIHIDSTYQRTLSTKKLPDFLWINYKWLFCRSQGDVKLPKLLQSTLKPLTMVPSTLTAGHNAS